MGSGLAKESLCGPGEVLMEAALLGSVPREWGTGVGEDASPDLSTQDSGTNTDIPSVLSEGTAWGMRLFASSQEISSICF